MKRFILLLLFATTGWHLTAASPEQARETMVRATTFMRSIATEGGYLWRYSEDLKTRAGENPATDTEVWIQPPGTPSMGATFLRAYEVTKDRQFLDAARAAGAALVKGQLESGGWDYSINFAPEKFKLWHRRADKGKLSEADAGKRKNVTTFDDNNTQSALRFMMALSEAVKESADPEDAALRAATEYGLKKAIEAQYPNGAWPQRYDGKPRNPDDFPIKKAHYPADWPRVWPHPNYAGYYTFNDNSIHDCIDVMLEAYHRYGKPEYLAAAKKGGDFMILAQMPEPQPAWAQQYNRDMEPAWARAFEPPAVTGGESAGVIKALIELYLETGEEKYLAPIPPALAWYKRSEIGPNQWARYYELETNKQLFGDRDGKIYYRLADISEERQHGYSWSGSYGVANVISLYEKVKTRGREAYLKSRQPKPLTAAQREERHKSLEPKVDKLIAALDEKGRWLVAGHFEKKVKNIAFEKRIDTDVFIANMKVLCDYLETAR